MNNRKGIGRISMSSESKPFLSICLIAKNEAKYIPRLVESLEGIHDELIVVDTGSDDDTAEVARKLGAKVFFRPWDDSFSRARNYSCDQATGEWIFCPDCDEVVRKPHNFLDFLKKQPPQVNLVSLSLHTSWDERGNLLTHFAAQRCFRRGTHRWHADAHEYLSPVEGVEQVQAFCEDAWFEHHPDLSKNRVWYINVLRKQANESPDDGRYLFYMGREAMYYGLYAEAIGYLQRCVEKHAWGSEKAQARIFMADCYAALKEFDKAEEQLILSLKEDPTRRDATFKLAEFYRERGEHQKAVVWYRMCTAVPYEGSQSYFCHEEFYGALPFLRMAYSYWYLGQVRKAREAFMLAKQKDPEMPELVHNAHYFELPKVCVVIPTRFREESLNKLLTQLEQVSETYPEMEVIVCRDELETPRGFAKAANAALKRSTAEYIAYLEDDSMPQYWWLFYAMQDMKKFPDGKGMVGFNNRLTIGECNTFVIHRDMLKLLPYNEGVEESKDLKLFNEDYTHNFADRELMECMLYHNRYRWCGNAVVLHNYYDPTKSSPGAELRVKDESDERAENSYQSDFNLFKSRRHLWVRPWTFGAVVPAFKDGGEDGYLDEVLYRLTQVIPPDKIVGLMGPPILDGVEEDVEDEETKAIFKKYGIEILWCEERKEDVRRNKGIEHLGTDYVFIVDSDEIWDVDDLKKLISMAQERPYVDCWGSRIHQYWKSTEWRIDPMDPFIPVVLVKNYIRFYDCRLCDSSNMVDSGLIFHNMGWARSDDTIKRKIAHYNHPSMRNLHPMRPNWYEEVWCKWTPENSETMTGLHPTHPDSWRKAVRVPDEERLIFNTK